MPFKKWIYPSVTLSNPSIHRFPDESGTGKDKGNILGFIINGQVADRQFDWFVPDKMNGLTQAGLSGLNQSVEAFVYCILGAQVNVRSGILGDGGRRASFSHYSGGRFQAARPGQARAALPAGCRQGKGET